MNVVLFEPSEVDGGLAILDGPRAAHVVSVLRAAVGSTIRVGVVDGPLGTAEVIAIERAPAELGRASGQAPPTRSAASAADPLDARAEPRVRLRVMLEQAPAPVPRVDLILAVPRPKVLARLFSPLAQLGVRRLMLTGAYKVEKAYFDTHVLTPETWRPLLLEGLAQVRDTRMPLVTVHRSPTWLVREELPALAPEPALRMVGDAATLAAATPSATTPAATTATTPRAAVLGRSRDLERVILAIGPEGGWAPREERLFDDHGFVRVSLGARTLRSDVAVIALLSAVHDALDRER